MNKEQFLTQLEQLLFDIPAEERQEAMDYYRSYFEDAGAENEAAVLAELGSPQKIAASVREGIGKEAFGQSVDAGPGSASGGGDVPARRRGRIFAGMDKKSKWILIVIAAVFTFPVWSGLAGGIIGIMAGLFAAIVGVVLALVGTAAAGVLGGIVCLVIGVARFFGLSFVQGVLFVGVGALFMALGGLSTVLLLLLCGKFFPWAFRELSRMARSLWEKGRRLA